MDRIHLAFFTHESERAGKKGEISRLKAPESRCRAVPVTAHAPGGETPARTPVPGQTVWVKSADLPTDRAENCRLDASSGLMRRGMAQIHTPGRAENCRSDAGSGLMGRRKSASSPTGQGGNCRFAAAPGRAPHGRRAFYAGAVVPLSWGFML